MSHMYLGLLENFNHVGRKDNGMLNSGFQIKVWTNTGTRLEVLEERS